MKQVTILVPHGGMMGSIEMPRQVFSEVNAYLESTGKPPLFRIQMAGLAAQVPVNNDRYLVNTDAQLKDIKQTDLIIIPALEADMDKYLAKNSEFIPWMVKQYKGGAEIASLCVGAFLLASTGLLTGRRCTTHWRAVNVFKRMFPEIELVEDKIITDERGIYSSGGGLSFVNLLLYLVEKFAGQAPFIFCSKFFQVDMDRKAQSPFIIFNGQKDHEDESIRKAQEFIEKNIHQRITVDQLANMLALGKRNLERRFKKATSNTVGEYTQRVKIEAAKASLVSSRYNVNEVMYSVGYTSTKAFRTTFKRITGLSPVQYRAKYNWEQVAGHIMKEN
ncbi:GlxA family transcriptional regulator [Chitinophaga barathri]|uniref:Helix-turn-helix domain-containing protein n=1 Tax=Chitinophaga barathri TaxID=1647451 RepID=A0A3N4MGB9_9BACT|nr:helix-turn-helix domain-containing protein [Chitinophaga barathri]RPD39140.1 helix-turn-helix domain-containing protein [Chitinophaga barathri]